MSHKDTVYVVDDDDASREAVESLVAEMDVEVRSYESAEQFLDDFDGRRPGCLVTDVRMLRMSGLELQEELNRRGITLAVVVLTAYAETPVVVRAIKNGAVTLLEKPCRDLQLWDAIREGLATDAANYEREQRVADIQQRLKKITPAENEVLQLMLEGVPNKAMATKLDISTRTVEARRQQIFAKLQAESVAELVRLVLEAQKQE